MLEVSESTCFLSPSSASAKNPPFSIQKSLLNRRFSAAASVSRRSASAESFQIDRARRAERSFAS